LPLPNVSKGFTIRVGVITYNVNIGLTNGRLRGLQTFRRASCFKGEFFIIDADLVVNNNGVGISYDGGITGSLPGSFTASDLAISGFPSIINGLLDPVILVKPNLS